MDKDKYRTCVELDHDIFVELIAYSETWGESPSETLKRVIGQGLNAIKVACPRPPSEVVEIKSINEKL